MSYIAEVMPVRSRLRAAPTESGPGEASAAAQHTIDELALASAIPSRTIRFYQSKGVLMPPLIRGRVAFYTDAHLERLKLVGQLQERGLRIDAIAGLVGRIERGELDLAQWLGVEKELATSWTQDHARTVSEEELVELVGRKRPGLIADLLQVGFAKRRGEVFLVENPSLLSIAMKAEAAGVDLGTMAKAAEILNKHLRRAVRELRDLLLARARAGTLALPEQSKALEALRPLGMEAVRLLFAKQVERGLREALESGALARGAAPRHAKSKSRARSRRS